MDTQMQVNTVTKIVSPSPLFVADEANQNLFKILEFTGNWQPDSFPIIESNLRENPQSCILHATTMEILADLIEKYDNVDDLIFGINDKIVTLIDALKETEALFYQNQNVKEARQDLYSLRSGFGHSGGNSLMLFVCKKDHFQRGTKEYFTRLEKLLTDEFEKFECRELPAYIATTWAMENAMAVKEFAELGQAILAMTVHSLPHFQKCEDQLRYLEKNPVANTNKTYAFATVFNAHANINIKDGLSDVPLPVPIHLSFAARMSFAETGTNLSSNSGVGLSILEPVVKYHKSELKIRDLFAEKGVLTLTRNKIRSRTTTCVAGDKPVLGDYCGMDSYLTVCRSIYAMGVDLVDVSWNDKLSEKKIKGNLKLYFDSLMDVHTGRRVFSKAVIVDKDVKISRDKRTGRVTILAKIAFPNVIKSVEFMVDPVFPTDVEG